MTTTVKSYIEYSTRVVTLQARPGRDGVRLNIADSADGVGEDINVRADELAAALAKETGVTVLLGGLPDAKDLPKATRLSRGVFLVDGVQIGLNGWDTAEKARQRVRMWAAIAAQLEAEEAAVREAEEAAKRAEQEAKEARLAKVAKVFEDDGIWVTRAAQLAKLLDEKGVLA